MRLSGGRGARRNPWRKRTGNKRRILRHGSRAQPFRGSYALDLRRLLDRLVGEMADRAVGVGRGAIVMVKDSARGDKEEKRSQGNGNRQGANCLAPIHAGTVRLFIAAHKLA
jgi:hypothetical protein